MELAAQLFGEGFFEVIVYCIVLIGPGLIVGLIVSVIQTATQVNEQTLSFLPRLLATYLTIILAGGWVLARLVDYITTLYKSIPGLIS